jgi:hypothetical protein
MPGEQRVRDTVPLASGRRTPPASRALLGRGVSKARRAVGDAIGGSRGPDRAKAELPASDVTGVGGGGWLRPQYVAIHRTSQHGSRDDGSCQGWGGVVGACLTITGNSLPGEERPCVAQRPPYLAACTMPTPLACWPSSLLARTRIMYAPLGTIVPADERRSHATSLPAGDSSAAAQGCPAAQSGDSGGRRRRGRGLVYHAGSGGGTRPG